jgi:hypothetical protein
MWNDPIVEETRRLRDEYSAKHNYSIHEMVEDLNQWEKKGFPMPADIESNLTTSKLKHQNGTLDRT